MAPKSGFREPQEDWEKGGAHRKIRTFGLSLTKIGEVDLFKF